MTTLQQSLFEIMEEIISPKPFLKWAGGKSQLLDQLKLYFPKEFSNYYEPFVGSGAVYWRLFSMREQGEINYYHTKLSDNNRELINCYYVVKEDVAILIDKLAVHKQKHSKTHYYEIRAQNVETLSEIDSAARFIYLNKTCFNGLYRVNRKNNFNVPMGSYKNPRIYEVNELINASKALQDVELEFADFRNILKWAQKDDFIYFDPPYFPISGTANFTSYTKDSFGVHEQEELADVYKSLHERGCKIMLSNSWVDFIKGLYKDFNPFPVLATRAINSKPDRRGKIKEMLVINYKP